MKLYTFFTLHHIIGIIFFLNKQKNNNFNTIIIYICLAGTGAGVGVVSVGLIRGKGLLPHIDLNCTLTLSNTAWYESTAGRTSEGGVLSCKL